MVLVTLALSLSIFICRDAFGQTGSGDAKPHETKPQYSKSKDWQGNPITTKKWEEGDEQHTESTHLNKEGKITQKDTEVIGPDGTTGEHVYYKGDGSDTPTGKHSYKRDDKGKTIQVQNETYKDGVLVSGSISVPDAGTGHLLQVKRWNNTNQRYEDVSKEDLEKQRKEWELDERLRRERDRNLFPWFGKVSGETSGTGQTVGHVADIKLRNLTDQPLQGYLPATVVESRRGSQDYVIPRGQDLALQPHETKTVPLNGTCLERDRPAAGQDDPSLIYDNVDEPDIDSHFAPSEVVRLTNVERCIDQAVDQLRKDGAFDDFPYSDKQEQENIALQWATWASPDISDITGSPPANKDDFKKTVNDQVSKHHKPDKETRKKIDDGIDKMWDGIELTSEKAKDLEKTEGPEEEETPPPMPPGTVNVSNDTPTPAPQTTEKPKKEPPKPKPSESPAKGDGVPMTTTRLLVNVLKGVDQHDKDDVTRPTKDDIKKGLAKAVKDANKLLSKCGVQLELAGADIVLDAPNPGTPGSENMDGNYDGDKAKDIGKKAGEELKKAHGKETTGFKIYIVSEITNKTGSEQGVGYWFPEEGSDATHPGFCIIEASILKDGRLLAHELGHGLGGLPDGDTKGNLMNPNPGVSDANDLSDDQCKKLREGVKQRQ